MAQLTWWGHATTVIEVDGVRLLTDPVLRRRVGPLHNPDWVPPAIGPLDAVLVSHQHLDHLDLPSLRRLPAGLPLIVPPGAGRRAGRAGGPVTELAAGQSVRVGTVTVRATWADHPEGRWGRRPGPGSVGYWVEGTSSVYFAGDTAVFPEMRGLAGADLALLPIGGWGLTHGPGHMDPAEAGEAAALLQPGLVVPIHWGTLRIPTLWRMRAESVLSAGEQFRTHLHRAAPGVDVRVLALGESLSFPT